MELLVFSQLALKNWPRYVLAYYLRTYKLKQTKKTLDDFSVYSAMWLNFVVVFAPQSLQIGWVWRHHPSRLLRVERTTLCLRILRQRSCWRTGRIEWNDIPFLESKVKHILQRGLLWGALFGVPSCVEVFNSSFGDQTHLDFKSLQVFDLSDRRLVLPQGFPPFYTSHVLLFCGHGVCTLSWKGSRGSRRLSDAWVASVGQEEFAFLFKNFHFFHIFDFFLSDLSNVFRKNQNKIWRHHYQECIYHSVGLKKWCTLRFDRQPLFGTQLCSIDRDLEDSKGSKGSFPFWQIP